MKTEIYDVMIIGSGAAGLGAAIYSGRYLMKTLVVSGDFGGETAKAGTIWNYPGAKGVDGFDLMNSMKEQAAENGAEFVQGKVERITSEENCFTVQVGGKEFFGKTLIFAQGAERRRLNLPNENKLKNKGVHYCVTCDGPLYKDKVVAMVGGGDASIKGVNLLGQYATKIYLIVRGKELKGEPINQEQMRKFGDKIKVLFETEVKEIIGAERLEKIGLSKEHNGSKELAVAALFEEIGAMPNTELAESLAVALDERGYIVTDNMMKTNIPGIFAAGDTVNFFGPFKQITTSAAMGSVAATSAYNYYKTHGNLCEIHWKPAPSET